MLNGSQSEALTGRNLSDTSKLGDSSVPSYDRAVYVLRNPFDAILEEWSQKQDPQGMTIRFLDELVPNYTFYRSNMGEVCVRSGIDMAANAGELDSAPQ